MKLTRSVSRITANSVLSGAIVLLGVSGILNAQEKTYTELTAAHSDWVQVPGKLMRADCVHEIPNGAQVVIGEKGEPTGDVMMKGKLFAHYEACSEAPVSTRHLAKEINRDPTARSRSGAAVQWLGRGFAGKSVVSRK